MLERGIYGVIEVAVSVVVIVDGCPVEVVLGSTH